MSQRTTLEIEESIAWIALDDGKVNAMSAEMLEEIGARLEATAEQARATVLIGRKGIFSAGFDLGTFRRGAEATERMIGAGVRLIGKLLAHPHPVVTACTGHAYPMGAFLMLAADARYAIAGPWKIGMNEVAIGLTVPHFALELARNRLSPAGFARIPSGVLVPPEEAVGMGYVDRVVAESDLLAVVRQAAQDLGGLDGASYRATKQRVNQRVIEDVAQAWAAHGFG